MRKVLFLSDEERALFKLVLWVRGRESLRLRHLPRPRLPADLHIILRAVAQRFGISKSAVHKDVTQTLEKIDPSLYELVKEVLDINKSERHLRGGEATKQKYLAKNHINSLP